MPGRILVVDDSRTVRRLVRQALAGSPDLVLVAANGAAGLAAARAAVPDLILLDAMMPVMGGAELLQRLEADARLRGVPVLILATAADVARAAVPSGRAVCGLIRKPCTAAAVLAAVGAWRRVDRGNPPGP